MQCCYEIKIIENTNKHHKKRIKKCIYGLCPWCKIHLEIAKKNCGILRCGIYLKNGKWRQLPKHGKEKTINRILNECKYIGCGNPIKITKENKFIKTKWNI